MVRLSILFISYGGAYMGFELPGLDKTAFSVSSLQDETEELKYWLNKSPSERMEAIEINWFMAKIELHPDFKEFLKYLNSQKVKYFLES